MLGVADEGGIGGAGFVARSASLVIVLVSGSVGPGPGTLIAAGGSCGRGSGTKAAREWGLSAGLSMSAFPAALRMKV